jgi:hypothetical protein
MHWGHRSGNSGKLLIGIKTGPKKEGNSVNQSEDHKKKILLKKKRLNEMSNSEIKALNERLMLEKQYKDLTKTDISPGVKFVTDLLASSAKQTVSAYTSKYMAKGVEQILKKAVNTKG